MDDCIFCRIISGKIPCTKIYEDNHVLSFLDIEPISDGHTLVIPKEHVVFMDQADPKIIEKIAGVLPLIAGAVKEAVNADGYNILNNNGLAAGQKVDHLHFHIIPRKQGDKIFPHWPAYQYPAGKAEEIAEIIQKKIEK